MTEQTSPQKETNASDLPKADAVESADAASEHAQSTQQIEEMKSSASAPFSPIPRRRFPRACIAIYIFTALSAILYFVFTLSPSFSDWFNANISDWGRKMLSFLTVWIPFSFAEWLLLLTPFILVWLIVIAIRKYSDTWRDSLIYTGKLVSVLCVVISLFIWNFAPGYYGSTLDQKLQLDRREVSASELYQTATILSKEIEALSDTLIFPGDAASSVMPYSYNEMNQKLMQAYEAYTQKHDFPNHFYSRVKPVMLSKPMSYTHITGVYSFFTGEANINVNFPDYCIPYTAAHELAHQRGVAREDEANMIAFLVCMESDDPYIRYSALMNVYEYVASALNTADSSLYRTLYLSLCSEIRQEQAAYSAFFDQYRENVAADISEATNNAYLQSQGAPQGSRSYNMVVDLTVAYYREAGALSQNS